MNASSSGLSLTKKVRPDELLVGSGLLYVGVVDYDGDGYDDVSYDAGLESVDVGDMNYDGTNNVLDVVLLVNDILLTP